MLKVPVTYVCKLQNRLKLDETVQFLTPLVISSNTIFQIEYKYTLLSGFWLKIYASFSIGGNVSYVY